jgi:hypothetical protein
LPSKHPLGRRPPADVARALRRESRFGCAICGSPFLTYHHIVPWEEERHFRTEDMMALCPNCHARVGSGRMTKDKQYNYKHNPARLRDNTVNAMLEFSIPLHTFVVGGNQFTKCPDLIFINDLPLFSWRVTEFGFTVNANFMDKLGNTLLCISEGEITTMTDLVWDFEFKFNIIKIRHRQRDLFVCMDLRQSPGSITGSFFVGRNKIIASGSRLSYFGNSMKGLRFMDYLEYPAVRFCSEDYEGDRDAAICIGA